MDTATTATVSGGKPQHHFFGLSRRISFPVYSNSQWAYKECARCFVAIPILEFRTSYTHHELGCTLQRVEMEKCQRSPEEIAKYGPLTEEQMERRAKVRGLLALVSTKNDRKKWIEFVNWDFNAAINIRGCAVLERRPPE
jgi:hypothetical protein